MTSDRDNVVERYSVLSTMKLSEAEQSEIWGQLEQRMSATQTITPNRRGARFWGPSAAAAVAVLIVAGSIYALSQNGSSRPPDEPHVTAANVPSLPASSSIRSIYITADNPAQTKFLTNHPAVVEHNVSAWLKSSKVYTSKIDESNISQGTYVGPAQLHIDGGDHKSIVIYPVSHVEQENGAYLPVYQQSVVAYRTGSHTTYLYSPELYTWLKNDQWQTEFNVFANPLFRTFLTLPNGQTITTNTTKAVTWKDLTINLLITNLPPVGYQDYAMIVGNNANIVSHENVATSAGPATLVYFQRTPPAAAAGTGNAVTNEFYVIRYGSQYAYVIQATATGKVGTAKSALMSLLQGWKVPKG